MEPGRIIVDRVFDTEEIVVKPVAPILRDLPYSRGDEVALLPPFAGGAKDEALFVRVQRENFSVDAEIDRLRGRFGTLVTVDRPAKAGDFVELVEPNAAGYGDPLIEVYDWLETRIDAVVAAAEGQRKTVMREAFPVQALIRADLFHELHRAFFQHAGADTVDHVGLRAGFEDHRLDPGLLEETPQQKSRRSGPDN